MKYFLFIFVAILLFSCETKEYTPSTEKQRDSLLIGTWRNINIPKEDSSFTVFTNDGYYGSSYWVNNKQIHGFTNLYGLWHSIEMSDSTSLGSYYRASIYEEWTSKRWTGNDFYKIKNDTLYVGSKENKLNTIYVKNSYQLIFDNKYYTGIDTTRAEE